MRNINLHSAALPALLLAASALAGCSTFRPPQIEYDEPPIEAALLPEPARPVEVVERPVPLPLPGQLMSVEHGGPLPEVGEPPERIEEANAAARIEPVRDGFINLRATGLCGGVGCDVAQPTPARNAGPVCPRRVPGVGTGRPVCQCPTHPCQCRGAARRHDGLLRSNRMSLFAVCRASRRGLARPSQAAKRRSSK